jgi:hypothetical protein
MSLKPCVSLVLIATLLPQVTLPVQARSQTASQIRETAEVKDSIESHGLGPKAKATITTRNGTKVKGYISETRDESFTITDATTKATTTIAFADVADVDTPFPRWATLTIVGGVGGMVGLVFYALHGLCGC